jgi:hypothetical protein
MTLKFDISRVHRICQKLGEFKHETPIVAYNAIKRKDAANVFILITGHGLTSKDVEEFNMPFFDDKILITYDKLGTEENKNRASLMSSKYIKELDHVIETAMHYYPKKQIFLLGES